MEKFVLERERDISILTLPHDINTVATSAAAAGDGFFSLLLSVITMSLYFTNYIFLLATPTGPRKQTMKQ
ncbi:MAG: hypothetical protein QWI73_04035 [Alphaproteobacteria bacterium]|nr:hypothetical protein [Alphaproteobacteria bacterium]